METSWWRGRNTAPCLLRTLCENPELQRSRWGSTAWGRYFLVDSLQGPHHLVYFVTGLGADLVFGLFRYKRYDVATCIVAGIASQLFWIPVSYVYHNVLSLYTTNFIIGDISIRILGGAVGDGLLGGALGDVILHIALAARKSRAPKNPPYKHKMLP